MIASPQPRSFAVSFLRREWFGGLFYVPRVHEYYRLAPEHFSLLADAARSGESVIKSYGRLNTELITGMDELADLIWCWQEQGLLDEDLGCSACVVDEPGLVGLLSAPLYLQVQLTRACNQRCRHCFVDTCAAPAVGELTADDYRRLFAQLACIGCPSLALSGGEPLLRPDLPQILRALGDHGLDARLFTNGTLITPGVAAVLAEAPLCSISVSLDGADAATHDRVRGAGSFERAVAGIRHLVAAGAPQVQLRVTVTSANAGSLDRLAELSSGLAVQRVALMPFRLSRELAPRARDLYLERTAYAQLVAGLVRRWPASAPPLRSLAIDRADLSPYLPTFGCPGAHTTATVTPDGRFMACGFFDEKDAWNVREHALHDCWMAAPNLRPWRRLEAGGVCRACRELARCHGGCRARALGAGRGMDDPDPWGPCAVEGVPNAAALF
ncbi:MAG: radical SAM protein [Deltaproteobacteria bacterium]|nr:radical SAM protein [Deltaproteobacteria bacterium]